jgi:hypothetical protein
MPRYSANLVNNSRTTCAEAPAPSSRLPPDEERAIILETLERHYRGLLDQPVPMLGDVSPRKAARSNKGREKLVA